MKIQTAVLKILGGGRLTFVEVLITLFSYRARNNETHNVAFLIHCNFDVTLMTGVLSGLRARQLSVQKGTDDIDSHFVRKWILRKMAFDRPSNMMGNILLVFEH